MDRIEILYQKAVDFADNNLDSELTDEERRFLSNLFTDLSSKDILDEEEVEQLKTVASIFDMYGILEIELSSVSKCSEYCKGIILDYDA